MLPFSPKYKKPSFDAMTYVKPSYRDVQQRPWQPDTWETPERRWLEGGPVRVPEAQLSFVNAGLRRTQHLVFGAGSDATLAAQWPGYHGNIAHTVALNQPMIPMWRALQQPESSLEDFYGTTESSSSYWDSRFSSECATVIRATGRQGFNNDCLSVDTAHATWTASVSSTLEEPGSSRHEACSGREYSDSSSWDESGRSRFSGHLCLPIAGLAVLTLLLIFSAVTTVLRMNGVAGPAAASSQPLQPTSRDLAVNEIVAMMTPRKLLPQPAAAAVLPKAPRPLRRRVWATSRSAGNPASSTTGEDELGTASATTNFFAGRASTPFAAPIRPGCEEPSYTYCSESNPEFIYSRSRKSCLRASDDTAELCSRGRNRFTSMHRCEIRCVSSEHPSPSCLQGPLFVPCGRADVKSNLWFFDGDRCKPWNFPSGRCPANGSDVFATASECTNRCTNRKSAPCATPQPATCRRRQLRFPFFAHYSTQGGRFLCLKASAAVLRGRRCPTGENRFNSTQACEDVCSKPTA